MRPKFGAAYGLGASSMVKPFLAPSVSAGREELLFLVVTVWLGGGILLPFGSSRRSSTARRSSRPTAPPYWINMGR